jgi:hypothetical protein
MPGLLRNGLSAAALALACSAPPVAAMGVLPNCLDQLTARTETWSVCTHKFSRTARQCRQSTANMWNAMQECTRKGYSKQEIDAAMAEGAAKAGRAKTPSQPVSPAPTPRPRSSPIPGIDPPRENDGN